MHAPNMNLEDCRRFYAEEIRFAAQLTSPALVEAFAHVPREDFLGPAPWQVASPEVVGLVSLGLAGSAYVTTDDPRDLYHNVLAAIDPARKLNNGQPSALAAWINALDLKAGQRVFHLGCGVGYYTAILAEMVGASGSVVASEVDPDLAARSSKNLASYPNVKVHSGDGALVDPGICDAMLINAGVTHPHVSWLEKLSDGGRIVLPITATIGGSSFGRGVMTRITRHRSKFSVQAVTYIAVYSCTSVRDPQLDPVVARALGSGTLLKVKSLRRDPHAPEETCVLHRPDMCLSTAAVE
ncbi:MAG: rRNA adenine N-6-methyltransferase family protein [Candidatus Sulfotelmatobacter sp.]